jgi:hypothetical protein
MSHRKKTPELYMMQTLKAGDSFYTEKPDRHLTAIAHYYGIKIKTERVIAVSVDVINPTCKNIVKVTLI